MRRKSNPLKYKIGHSRVICKFLWWPVCIEEEWRWLETAYIMQVVKNVDVGGSMEFGNYKAKWVNECWVNRESKTSQE